jgi:tRNA nucleotidyltransferase (CCA-adding enzyme)
VHHPPLNLGAGRDPLGSIQLICDLGLHSTIFYIAPTMESSLSDRPDSSTTAVVAATALFSILSPSCTLSKNAPALHPLLASSMKIEDSAVPRLYLAAGLTPFGRLVYRDSKGKSRPATELVLRDGLKLGRQNHYFDGIPALFAAAAFLKGQIDEVDRVAIGLALREKSVHNFATGSHWATSLLFSLVQELVPLWSSQAEAFDG